MKVWLYYRLSRDEDEELNSLNNQRKIIYNFAVSNGHQVVGESFDDNVSGMHFNREGIDKIYEVVEAGKIEAIIVKDLSRLGRHRTQTALFIDYLRERNVRVLSATENIDTFNENDDLIIGFKGLVNDFYGNLPISNPNSRFNKGRFIFNVEPAALLEMIEAHLSSGKCPGQDKAKLKELAATLHENDNNLLFVGKLKR